MFSDHDKTSPSIAVVSTEETDAPNALFKLHTDDLVFTGFPKRFQQFQKHCIVLINALLCYFYSFSRQAILDVFSLPVFFYIVPSFVLLGVGGRHFLTYYLLAVAPVLPAQKRLAYRANLDLSGPFS